MASPNNSLSMWEQDFGTRFSRTPWKVIVRYIYGTATAPFVSRRYGPTFKSYTSRLAGRTLFSGLSLRQQKAVMAVQGGETAYRAACAKRSVEATMVDLPMGAQGFWLSGLDPSSQTQPVIVWFPDLGLGYLLLASADTLCEGGGYVLDVTLGHFEYFFDLVKALKETNGTSIAVLVVAYTLVPEQVYPYQIRQSIEAVRYVTQSLAVDPSRLILAGDSAGATLALDAIVHLKRPFDDSAPYTFDRPIKALLLVSPWADFDIDKYASYKAHSCYDIARAETFKRWSDAYLDGLPTDSWNAPAQADERWWQNTLNVGKILITGGADECLVDTITDLGEKIKAAYPENTILVVGREECHDAAIYAYNSQEFWPLETEAVIKSWLATVL